MKNNKCIFLIAGIFMIAVGIIMISFSVPFSWNMWYSSSVNINQDSLTILHFLVSWALTIDFIALIIALIGILLLHRFFVLSDRVNKLK